MSQGPSNPGFRSVKVQTKDFFQKGLTIFQNFFSIWVPMNIQQAWNAKLEGALSFDIHNCKKAVCASIKIRLSNIVFYNLWCDIGL